MGGQRVRRIGKPLPKNEPELRCSSWRCVVVCVINYVSCAHYVMTCRPVSGGQRLQSSSHAQEDTKVITNLNSCIEKEQSVQSVPGHSVAQSSTISILGAAVLQSIVIVARLYLRLYTPEPGAVSAQSPSGAPKSACSSGGNG